MISRIRSLRAHQGFMRYFANTSWLFAEKILRMVVGLFVGVWVARYLGPEQFGLFSYAQSFVGLFTAIATLGLDGIVVRELVKDESRRDELIGTAFWLKLMGAFGVLIILAIAVNFTSNDTYTNTLVFIIASATVFQSFNVVDMYFQSKVMGKYITYVNVISLLLSSIVKIALILNEASLEAFAWTIVFDSVVLAGGYIYFFLKNSTFNIQHSTFNKTTAINLLRDGWALMFSAMLVSVFWNIDKVMINEILQDHSVIGYYSVAIRLSEIWHFIPMVIVSTVFPNLVFVKNNRELFLTRLQMISNFLVLISVLISIFFLFFSKEIILLLFGHEYIKSSEILIIAIFSNIFVFLGVIGGRYFIVENLEKLYFYRTFYGIITNIALNYILIPKYGGIGAAYSTLISTFVVAIASDIFNFKTTKEIFYIKLKSLFLFLYIQGYKV